ncbi:MAG TPA: elongation factor Ts [Patescibacteria group bacterium]|nr:elongation factor Ts [Patescibacteria group bacterium]
MKQENIKKLREKTGVGVLNCQKALKESNGDINKALEILRKKGQKIVESKKSRATNEGRIGSYVHANGKIGVLVKVVCETDFVAKTDEFKQLAHDLAMQVAARNPKWLNAEEVSEEIKEKEKEIYKNEIKEDKPKDIMEKIINGKLEKFYNENCLLRQDFIKDGDITIKELLKRKISSIGENIKIKEFTRFEL